MNDGTPPVLFALAAYLGSLALLAVCAVLLAWPVGWVAHVVWRIALDGWHAAP